jgi:hypothetical protein
MEAINAKVDQLQKQLEQKEAQVSSGLQVSAMSLLDMKLKTGENLRKEQCQHLYKLMTIWKECQEQEHQRYQNAHVDLTKRDRLNRDELQETRQELIKVNCLFFGKILSSICISHLVLLLFMKSFLCRMITMLSVWRA